MMDRSDTGRTPEDLEPGCAADEHAKVAGAVSAFDDASFERAGRMLRAAGDPARLRLLELLSRGEMCVTGIASVTGEGLSTV